MMEYNLPKALAAGIVALFLSTSSLATTKTSPQVLSDLILAEMAVNENQLTAAHQYYLEATTATSNPEAAKRTLYLALSMGQQAMALNAAQQWAKLALQDAEAQLFAMHLSLQANQAPQALSYLNQALLTTRKDVLNQAIGELQRAPTALQQSMLDAIAALSSEQKNEPRLLLLTSLLQFETGNPETGVTTLDKVLIARPDWAEAIAYKADFLIQTHKLDAALALTKQKSLAYPQKPMLQLIYAEVLLKAGQVDAAQVQLNALTHQDKAKGLAYLLLAQIAVQQKNSKQATEYLQAATKDPLQANNAYFLLGEIYQFENKLPEAIAAYQKVTGGEQYLNAQVKAATLLTEAGKTELALDSLSSVKITNQEQAKQVILLQVEILLKQQQTEIALKVLNRALNLTPNDIELLYARSMVANMLNDQRQTEKDLRTILTLDPKQVSALNALGYLLIQDPKRYQEALGYTQKALALAPQDPAVLDTMGWLQYHLGNYQSASDYLKQAYQLDQNALIAAHYGEILWQLGDKSAAQDIWQSSLKKYPGDTDLTATIQHYMGTQHAPAL